MKITLFARRLIESVRGFSRMGAFLEQSRVSSWGLRLLLNPAIERPEKHRRQSNRCRQCQHPAISRLRMVLICSPDLLAHMVPATPDDSTCVVLTGNPR